jgi:hypothetical protein
LDAAIGNLSSASIIVKVKISTFSKTNDDILEEIPGLSVDLVIGSTYTFRLILQTTSNIAAGVKIGFSGTLSVSFFTSYVSLTDLPNLVIMADSLPGVYPGLVINATAVENGIVTVDGAVFCIGSGTLFPTFAQDVTNAAASSVIAGSFVVTKV